MKKNVEEWTYRLRRKLQDRIEASLASSIEVRIVFVALFSSISLSLCEFIVCLSVVADKMINIEKNKEKGPRTEKPTSAVA